MTKEEISQFIISSFDWEEERIRNAVEILEQPLSKRRAVDVPVNNVTVLSPGGSHVPASFADN